jgi:AGZA family xanthine/uracil permease-like MFS transporter
LETALAQLPFALPFALATIVGGIDCTESAAAAGDEYDTRAVLLTEGLASVAAGFMGGVIQTTPYIGHPAYKTMGGRAAYTIATALFIGAVGYFGWFTHLFEWLPRAAMFPILIYVGLEITSQSFRATPSRHYPALAIALLPALAYLATIPLGMAHDAKLDPLGVQVKQTLRCLANGFIVTSLLWAASLAALLDGRFRGAALYLVVAGVFALFGVIHSPLDSAPIDLPWNVMASAEVRRTALYQTPYHWAASYWAAAALLAGLSLAPKEKPEKL